MADGEIQIGDQIIPLGTDGMPVGGPDDYGIATLAYDVLIWGEHMLAQPDGDDAGEPWQWTPTQARFLAWFYAVDAHGVFVYRRSQMVTPKGSGKSPLAAAMSAIELAGPVVFDGFDSAGNAVGRPHPSPFVQLAAVSEAQSMNTFDLVVAMLRDGNAADDVPGLDPGLSRVRTRNGLLIPVTASASSREGGRTTFAVLDESAYWVSNNGGHRLAAVIRRNLAKVKGRSVEMTNAWLPGQESVAQRTFEYGQLIHEGRAVNAGLLRYHPVESLEDLSDEAALRAALERLYRDSPWVDIDRIVGEIYDPGTHPSDARRFFLNEVTNADDAWLAEYEWEAVKRTDLALEDGDMITLGFDGSRRRSHGVTDASALIAVRVTDGFISPINIWEQPADGPSHQDWEIPVNEVLRAVDDVFSTYNVVGFYADPARWEEHVAKWESDYGKRLVVKSAGQKPIAFWFSGKPLVISRSLDQFYTALTQKELSHNGSSALTRHALNARRRPTPSGMSIAKDTPDSPRKIDAIVAAVLAWTARMDAISAGVLQEKKRGRGFTF